MKLNTFIKVIEDTPEQDIVSSSTNENKTVWELFDDEDQDLLYRIVKPHGILLSANDGVDGYELFGDTPKERVLMFLKKTRAERIKVYE